MVDGTKSTVDFTDQLIDASSEILVLFHILSGGDGQLNKDNLSSAYATR
jgi:hypothetical protein